MSQGRYYQSSRMLIGPVVDDAAACYEKSNWISISLTPGTSKLLDNNQNVNSDILVKYSVPYKNFNANRWAINWTKYASEESLYKMQNHFVRRISKSIKESRIFKVNTRTHYVFANI